jgi:hypothetical protein
MRTTWPTLPLAVVVLTAGGLSAGSWRWSSAPTPADRPAIVVPAGAPRGPAESGEPGEPGGGTGVRFEVVTPSAGAYDYDGPGDD